MLDYLVVYDSETGNTKKIATEIFASLPGMSKDLINLHERTDFPEAKIYFVRSHPASGSGLKMTITISVLLSARGKCRLLSVKNMNPC